MWMGPFGFALAMGPICLAIQAAHRTRRATGDRFIRTTCVVAISAICFYFLEGYADFGLQTAMGIVLAYTLGGICLGFDYDRTRRASPAAGGSAVRMSHVPSPVRRRRAGVLVGVALLAAACSSPESSARRPRRRHRW